MSRHSLYSHSGCSTVGNGEGFPPARHSPLYRDSARQEPGNCAKPLFLYRRALTRAHETARMAHALRLPAGAAPLQWCHAAHTASAGRDSAYAFGAARGLGVGTKPLGQRPTSGVEELFIIAKPVASFRIYPFCKIYWNSYQLKHMSHRISSCNGIVN